MTTPSFPIDDYTRRPRRYMNVDGVVELSWSTVLLGFAFIEWLQSVTPADSLWHGHWAQLISLCAIALGVHFGGKAVKSRIRFRRTGYVQYRGSRTAPWVAAGTALVIAAVLTVLSGGHFRNPLMLLVAVVNILSA